MRHSKAAKLVYALTVLTVLFVVAGITLIFAAGIPNLSLSMLQMWQADLLEPQLKAGLLLVATSLATLGAEIAVYLRTRFQV